MPIRVAAVMTCFNRKDQTLACLSALDRQREEVMTAGLAEQVVAYVVDDGSSDGTGDAVAEAHPDAEVLRGDGTLYWNGGMRRALAVAFAQDYDYYLWLNDDTTLDAGALRRLLETAEGLDRAGQGCALVVGSTRDPVSGVVTYGGRHRPWPRRRTRFVVAEPPAAQPAPVETMNGNIVLVPRAVVQRIGNIDPAFRQKWGDQDYGLRARAAGCSVWIAPGTFGTCARNPDPVYGRKPLLTELRSSWDVKAFAPVPWFTFARRWAGPAWPVYWLSPYLHEALRVVAAHARRSRAA